MASIALPSLRIAPTLLAPTRASDPWLDAYWAMPCSSRYLTGLAEAWRCKDVFVCAEVLTESLELHDLLFSTIGLVAATSILDR